MCYVHKTKLKIKASSVNVWRSLCWWPGLSDCLVTSSISAPRSVAWELIPFRDALSRRGLQQIKLAYDHITAGTTSAFNRLGHYASSPSNRAYCYAELAVSSLAMIVTIASTHCANPRRDGQAELTWWFIKYRDGANATRTREQSPIPVLTGPDVG